jgi:hypothetical protein
MGKLFLPTPDPNEIVAGRKSALLRWIFTQPFGSAFFAEPLSAGGV